MRRIHRCLARCLVCILEPAGWARRPGQTCWRRELRQESEGKPTQLIRPSLLKNSPLFIFHLHIRNFLPRRKRSSFPVGLEPAAGIGASAEDLELVFGSGATVAHGKGHVKYPKHYPKQYPIGENIRWCPYLRKADLDSISSGRHFRSSCRTRQRPSAVRHRRVAPQRLRCNQPRTKDKGPTRLFSQGHPRRPDRF